MRRVLLALALSLAPSCALIHHRPVLIVEERTEDANVELVKKVFLTLCEQLPLEQTVRVRIGLINGPYYGLTSWNEIGQRFDIALDPRQPFSTLLDTLIHEYAHAMTWNTQGEEQHGPAWGVAYAKCYNVSISVRYPLGIPVPVHEILLDLDDQK